MKKYLLALLLIVFSVPAFASTWYVRKDGGSRFLAGTADIGQCDGLADVSYVSTGATTDEIWQPSHVYAAGTTITDATGHYEHTVSGGTSQSSVAGPTWGGTVTDGTVTWVQGAAYPTNQHCAFSDARYLWSTSTFTAGTGPGWGWVISGGDTVIIRGSIADGVSYPVGYNWNGTYCDANGCWGITGDQIGSGAPPPPSGTLSNPTRILGGNYAACSAQSARTQIRGRWGVGHVLALSGATNVDVECLDITDFSECSTGSTAHVACVTGGVILEDFAKDGIAIDNASTNITLNNVRIHGLGADGINGATGDGAVMTNIAILGNADAGWNADDGSMTTGVGSMLMQNFDISWNGCEEEYPIAHSVPYISCRDVSTGGYGDGFGTTTVASMAPGWQVHFDKGTVSYNTQDGLDALHINGSGSTITETRVLAFANEGQQLKAGGSPAAIQNSVIVTNCEALTSGTPIPGRPSPTFDDLGAPCRAGNTGVLEYVLPGGVSKFQNNTIFAAGAVALELEYADVDKGTTNVMQYDDNTFVGFFNAGAGDNPTPIFSNDNLSMLTNPGASWTHNSYFGYRSNWTCPATGETSALCVSPLLTDMSYHIIDFGDVSPATTSSPVYHAGVPVTGVEVDFNGAARSVSTPTIGACEPAGTACPGSSVPTAATPTFSPVAGTYATTQSVTISTTSGTVICYTTNGTTPATNGTTGCTTGTLYSGAVSVSVTTTIKAIAGGTGFLDSGVGTAAYVIAPAAATPTFSPVAGTYTSAQSVTISSSTAGATLCYTMDGTTPTANGSGTCTHGTTYSTAVSVGSSLTLKAIASKTGNSDSSVGSAAYTITAPGPTTTITGVVITGVTIQ